MSKIGSLKMTGASGSEYKFNVYKYGTEFKAIPAVYFISKRTENENGGATHSQIYIGQTSDLSERFDDHHKASCFEKKQANAHSIYQEKNEKKRLEIEQDLIDAYDPPCNG